MTQVKERPIIFSAPMVRAILDGRKTQTRRVVKHAPLLSTSYLLGVHKGVWGIHADVEQDGGVWRGKCPYGSVGDRIWVRETWRPTAVSNGLGTQITYMADQRSSWKNGSGLSIASDKQRPSIRMPRWASRITLEITDVRVQRLHQISEEDSKAEGVDPGCLTCGENCVRAGGCGYCRPAYRDSFCGLWKEINGPESWDVNPWIWALTFKVVR